MAVADSLVVGVGAGPEERAEVRDGGSEATIVTVPPTWRINLTFLLSLAHLPRYSDQ